MGGVLFAVAAGGPRNQGHVGFGLGSRSQAEGHLDPDDDVAQVRAPTGNPWERVWTTWLTVARRAEKVGPLLSSPGLGLQTPDGLNSLRLSVTSLSPSERAWAAISMSWGPMGVSLASN